MADEAVQAPLLPSTPLADAPFDVGDTELHFERPRDDQGRFAPIPVEPAAQLAPPPPETKHPAYLVERALDLGLEAEDLASVSTDQLNRLCWKLTQKQLKLREQLGLERTLVDATVRAPAPENPGPAAVAPAGVDEFDWGTNPETREPLTEADFHPTIARFMKQQAKENRELKTQLHNERAANQQREARSATDLIDAAFARLDNERLFGKGPASKLGPKDPQFKRRLAVLHEAGIELASINRGTIVSQLKEAADLLYAVPADKPADKPGPYDNALNGNGKKAPIPVAEWNGGAVAQPTARKGAAEPKGEELAVKNLAAKMRERGMLGEPESDAEIDDGLLG